MINQTIYALLRAGLSLIPTKADKRPAIASWTYYQSNPPTEAESAAWGSVAGYGIICGPVSGGVFCIDIDTKHDTRGGVVKEYSQLIKEQAPDLLEKLVVEKTPSGGFHFIGKCPSPLRNIKLAKNEKHEAIIETRGDGGYFCAAPTPGYSIIRGSLSMIQGVTPEELDILLDCARALNQEVREPSRPIQPKGQGTSPMDDYDARTSPVETVALLEAHGWKVMFRRGEATYLKRPGKEGRAISATMNHIPGRFYVFTTSTVFESEHVYKPCAVYAMLEHGGKFDRAAKALIDMGYGEKRNSESNPKAAPVTAPVAISAEPETLLTSILDIYDNGIKTGASPGWPILAQHYQIVKGQLNIFTGVPSHGKSEFTDAIMVNLAQKEAWNFVVYSPENYPVNVHARKLSEKLIGKSMFGSNRMSRTSLIEAIKWVNKHFTFLDGADEDVNLDSIFDAVLDQKKKRPVDGVIIDPWNELEGSRPEKMSETDFIGICLKRCRMFARKHDIWFAIVAHPTKMRQDPKGAYPIPTLYDISGSAHWYNKADNGIVVHRDFVEKTTRIIVQKIKFKYYGKPGDVSMIYDVESGRYREMNDHDNFTITKNRQLPDDK